MELCLTVEADLHDADRKIGKKTFSEAFSSLGGWTMGALGAEAGTYIGAGIGTAILPGIGTAIGGAAGGFILGLVGSYNGSVMGRMLVDISVTE